MLFFFGMLISFVFLFLLNWVSVKPPLFFPAATLSWLMSIWHSWNGFDMKRGEPSNVRVSRLYLGAGAPRCDIPALCQKWHTAVSASACSPPTNLSQSKSEVRLTQMENHFLDNPRCLLSLPQLMCWHGPQSHLRGKNRFSRVTAPVRSFPGVWQRAKVSAFGIFSSPGSACPTCWKLNAIRRVR